MVRQIIPKNFISRTLYSYRLEEYVFVVDVITQKHSRPPDDRLLCYSCWILSSFRESPDYLIALFLIRCVYLVNQHNSICYWMKLLWRSLLKLE